jgi:hypothetical protein
MGSIATAAASSAITRLRVFRSNIASRIEKTATQAEI